MFFTEQMLWARTRELGRRRFIPALDLFPMAIQAVESDADDIHVAYPGKITGEPARQNDEFIGWDRYAHLQKDVMLPGAKAGHTLWGLFDFGKTGGGNNSGFESLLFVNGEPYQAVDTNHGDVPLEAFAGQMVEFTFTLWTGMCGVSPQHNEFRHRLSRAEICYLHDASDELYRYARGICEAIGVLPENDTNRDALLAALHGAYGLLDWDADKLLDTVPVALACLMDGLGKLEKHSDITVHCAGHTHIDVAWLWRLKHTHEKTVRSFTTALRLADEFDDFVFLQSQPQLLSFLKKDAPALYARVKEKVANGQWEPEGAMWLEADCNISSGESLARQLLHGCLFLRNEFGRESEYLWLPDVFGYSWALPQLLKQANIKTFMTTKISWNQYNRMPHDLFTWRGIDGSEILTYFVTTMQPGQKPETSFETTYNGLITADTVMGAWNRFSDRALSRDVLISYGYGDGGGGSSREMVHNAHVLDKLPGLPNVKLSGGAAFFQKLHENVAQAGEHLQTWDGELYLEYHRGTYTTQAKNKKWNRLLENRLSALEWLDTTAILCGGLDHYQALHDAWECVLLHQFHDIIPGSSIKEVYADSMVNYANASASLDAAENEITSVLTDGTEGAYTLHNFASVARDGLVFVPDAQTGFTNAEGQMLPSQAVDGGVLVAVPIPALGSACITVAAYAEEAAPFVFDTESMTMRTPHYIIRWNGEGRIVSVRDKANDREVLAGEGNVFELYEDKPLEHDAWDVDLFHMEKKRLLAATGAPVLVESGALRAVLRFTFATGKSTITQDVIVYAGTRRIDFETTVDWHEDHRLLKAAFPMNIRTTKARYDIQYGYVERPTHWNTSWDMGKFEVVGHKWADMSEFGYGAALLNNCKYGYSARDNVLRITLLKSSKSPDDTADMGVHHFTYALLPHNNNLEAVIAEATAMNTPVQVMPGVPKDSRQLLHLAGCGINVDAVKRAEDGDGFVVRVHELLGGCAAGMLSSDYGIAQYAECNLLEDICGATVEAVTISFDLKPFEIRNFRVWFNK